MPAKKRWVRDVKTVSTSPPAGLFTKDAQTIARTMASKKVSPKGIGSGIRMVQMFINRAGKGLSKAQKKELEKAKHLLQEKKERQEGEQPQRGRRKKSSSHSKLAKAKKRSSKRRAKT